MPPSGLASSELAGLIQSWVDSGAQTEVSISPFVSCSEANCCTRKAS